jgi:aldehyde dehydrogenase (NAD+)
LIIGAWNYPVQLTLLPLVGAIASGNTCIVKPSELSENTAQVLAALFPKYLDPECFRIVNGAIAESTAVLDQRFDKILYTGNGMVGRIIVQKAAKYLTPVLLELGGKSPAIVDKNSDLAIVGRRIAWGKFVNAGQTCICPDYVICEKSVEGPLIEVMKKTIEEFYGKDPQKSEDYGRIVNDRHFTRVTKLLTSGKVAFGGKTDPKDRYISPTILTDVDAKSEIMADEIFGPVLPIMTVNNIQEAIDYVNQHDKPLALYVFSKDDTVCEKVLRHTFSGGAVANDTLMHASVHTLPFGGVGPSGSGAYHGKLSFEAFSHQKAVMVKNQNMEVVNAIRYPPYSDTKTTWISRLMMERPHSSTHHLTNFLLKAALVGLILAGTSRMFPEYFKFY